MRTLDLLLVVTTTLPLVACASQNPTAQPAAVDSEVPNRTPEASTGADALGDAVRRNDLQEASELLQRGVDPNERTSLGYPPLTLAAGRGNYQMVDLLLSAGADVHMLDSRMGSTALHRAAQSGVVPVAKLLVRHGAFIDMRSPTNGNTPLIDASWHRKPRMVEYLLEAGANWKIKARGTLTAKSIAQKAGDDEIVQIIEDYEQRAESYRESTDIYTLIEDGDAEGVRQLIDQGLDVNQKATYRVGNALRGVTPLLYAARLGQHEIVEILLEAGANPRIVDWTMKSTVLHKSGYTGQPDSIARLVDAGAELDAQGPYNGYTALHDATWHGHADTVRALLDAGATPGLEGLDGNTPLDLAREYGYDEIAEMLKQARSDSS